MRRLILFVVRGMAGAGCGQIAEDSTITADAEGGTAPEYSQNNLASPISGETAYKMICSMCHDSARSGAPLTGDQDAWKARSPMWNAVLAEHASNGYMDMPARGGSIELSDEDVIRAVEYMMSRTYPERLPD